MDHDTAYVEAVGSLHTLGGLQYLGLEFPEDRYGAIPVTPVLLAMPHRMSRWKMILSVAI